MDRAEHLLDLYNLVHDTRSRGVRSDWATSFKETMHWPHGENIVRVDGHGQNSMLILRERLGIDRDRFTHNYASELLRSTVVTIISALDRFVHDLVVYYCWKVLNYSDDKIPKQMRKISIPVVETKRAVLKGRNDKNSRPGHIVKKAIQEHLHNNFTFQKPSDVIFAMQMLGVIDFWGMVAAKMSGSPSKEKVIEALSTITRRRNQIVHEADLVLRTKAQTINPRDISYTKIRIWTDWMKDFGQAVNKVVLDAV